MPPTPLRKGGDGKAAFWSESEGGWDLVGFTCPLLKGVTGKLVSEKLGDPFASLLMLLNS
jgi:hypothetical protein